MTNKSCRQARAVVLLAGFGLMGCSGSSPGDTTSSDMTTQSAADDANPSNRESLERELDLLLDRSWESEDLTPAEELAVADCLERELGVREIDTSGDRIPTDEEVTAHERCATEIGVHDKLYSPGYKSPEAGSPLFTEVENLTWRAQAECLKKAGFKIEALAPNDDGVIAFRHISGESWDEVIAALTACGFDPEKFSTTSEGGSVGG